MESVATLPWNARQLCYGISGKFCVESVATFVWNGWQLSYGTGGNFRAEYAHLVSICAGDGRDVIGTFAASDARQDVHATLIESHPELVTRGQAAVDQLGLARRIKERDVQRLIAALPSLCDREASVIWTRSLFDDGEKATQIIRKCFVAADFTEEVLVRTPLGLFAVGTHAFRGVWRPLPVNKTLFEFTGFASIPSAGAPDPASGDDGRVAPGGSV